MAGSRDDDESDGVGPDAFDDGSRERPVVRRPSTLPLATREVAAPPMIGSRVGVEPRILAAWREWLSALATNAEAAVAAAQVYGDLLPGGRDALLDALAEDAPRLEVPLVAVYAPLLSVETDPARRYRIESMLGDDLPFQRRRPLWALRGFIEPTEARRDRPSRANEPSARVVALVCPLYLDFVRVLWCKYLVDDGFDWARHDPILRRDEAPADGAMHGEILLEATPAKLVVEELAHAILAHRRRGVELPASLSNFVELFDAHVEGDTLS